MSRRSIHWTLLFISAVATARAQTPGNIFQATLGESGQRTAEVSTEQLRAILADKSAVVDSNPVKLESPRLCAT